jgi:hypothetical protein
MYPLWDPVIEPILRTAGAQRVVEIGALQGETTVKLLDLLGEGAEVHVIDPLPQFDPSEHERRFPGRYHFHRGLSHDVLPTLPPVDAALIDGDHNWYTVYNELKMLAATAREAGTPLPLLFMHDVGWPYGRRDLYYAPERIPEEFRQPYAQKGLQRGVLGHTRMLERGGFNPRMNNATRQGGPRNGVLTALDDFVAEYEETLRIDVLPLYFGLAIVADEGRLQPNPELAASLERLRTPQFLSEMLELAERLRLKETQWGQVVFYHWQDRLDDMARRYLDLVRGRLTERPAAVDHLEQCLETIRAEKVEGDFIVCGPSSGDRAIFVRGFAQAHEMNKVSTWIAALPSDNGGSRGASSSPSLEDLRQRFGQLDLMDRLELRSAPLVVAFPPDRIAKVALLSIGPDVEAAEALELLYERVTAGGFVVLEDAGASARRAAIDAFRASRRIAEPVEVVEGGAALGWRKVG